MPGEIEEGIWGASADGVYATGEVLDGKASGNKANLAWSKQPADCTHRTKEFNDRAVKMRTRSSLNRGLKHALQQNWVC